MKFTIPMVVRGHAP